MDKSAIESLIKNIIYGQKMIIGPMAVEQANKVNGLDISTDLSKVEVKGELKQVLIDLVKQYEQLFGQASIEVCKDAVKEIKPPIPEKSLPEVLR